MDSEALPGRRQVVAAPGLAAGPARLLILLVGVACTLAGIAFADGKFAPDAVEFVAYLEPWPFLVLLVLAWERAPCNGVLVAGAIACALVGVAVLVAADGPKHDWALGLAWFAQMGTMVAFVAVVFVWRIVWVEKHPQH
jgi:hypothetical protein